MPDSGPAPLAGPAPVALLDRPATPTLVRRLGQLGVLDRDQLDDALGLVRARADRGAWRHFAERALLFFGLALVVAAVVFFFAANWSAMGRATRLGLAIAAHVIAAVCAAALGTDRVGGRAAAAGAALLVGPALLTYGQAYQTGADAWELFMAWAVLAVPFAVVVRGTALWVVVLVLLRVAGWLYVDQHMERYSIARGEAMLWLTAALGLVDVVAVHLARRFGRPVRLGEPGRPTRGAWAVGEDAQASTSFAPLAFTALGLLTAAPALLGIACAEYGWSAPMLVVLAGAVTVHLAAGQGAHRRGDAPALALVLLSLALHTGTAAGQIVFDVWHLKEAGLLFMTLFVLGQATLLALALRLTHLRHTRAEVRA